MSEYERKALTKDRLLEAMREIGKSQADLVRDTGLNRGTISRYLSGAVEPRHEATHKLAKALGVSEMWLFGYDAPKVRTEEQKKNDQLAQLIVRMRTDVDFFATVSALAELDEKQYRGVKDLVAALKK
jgi:transcriptional regulator with XRE-family HTH domain